MTIERSVRIAGRSLGQTAPPFIIAELSGNHNGSLERCLEIIDSIADAGAHAVKFQTYTPSELTIRCDSEAFRVRESHQLWAGRALFDLYEEAQTPRSWHPQMYAHARARGLIAFSSVFHSRALELLEELGAPAYKIASAELVDLPLIRAAARTSKPLIMSTGMASLGEIEAAVNAAHGAGCSELVLMACTAAYPADPTEARLRSIPLLRETFDVPVGVSDHTRGIGVAVAAVALGAAAVEKHVTLRRSDGGIDSAFSLEPGELSALVGETKAAWQAVSASGFGPTHAEAETLRLRRSLHVTQDVQAGDTVDEHNVRSIRPAGGLSPDAIDIVIGRRFAVDVSAGTPLTWDLL